jgi:hypothetical protein
MNIRILTRFTNFNTLFPIGQIKDLKNSIVDSQQLLFFRLYKITAWSKWPERLLYTKASCPMPYKLVSRKTITQRCNDEWTFYANMLDTFKKRVGLKLSSNLAPDFLQCRPQNRASLYLNCFDSGHNIQTGALKNFRFCGCLNIDRGTHVKMLLFHLAISDIFMRVLHFETNCYSTTMSGHRISFVMLAILVTTVSTAQFHTLLSYYEHAHHKGESNAWILNKNEECTNFGAFNDRISSVNTNNRCAILYEDQDCQGRSLRIAPGEGCHFNLADCDFNDVASSMRVCP